MVKRFYAIIFFILSLWIGKAQKLPSTDSIKNIKVIAFSDLKEIIKKNDDKLLVVNFWATWCMPCVMEIPTFMKINEKYKNNVGYKMVLINLNQVENIEFVKKIY